MKPWENYQQTAVPAQNGGPWSQYAQAPQEIQQPQMSRREAAFVTATNPLNFGDELKAGIAALYAKTFGGEATKDIDIGDLYREARDTERAKLAQAKEQYPIQSGAIGFASDIPLEVAALGKLGLTGAKTLPSRIAEGAAGGYALGAAGGAGASEKETIGGVLSDAQASGEIGGVAGGILTPAIPLLGKGATAIKNVLSKKSAQEVAQGAIPKEVAQKGLEQLRASPEGQPTVGLDLNQPEAQSFVKSVLSKYPQAHKIADEFSRGRKDEAVKRIDDTLSKDISPVDTYFGDLAEKQKLQKIRGKENYDKAFANGEVYQDEQLSRLITTRPDFTKAAAKEAADLIQIEQGVKVNPNELLQPTTKNVDMIKRGLDVLIDKETDALGKVSPKGRALTTYKNQILNRIDALNPDYKKARNIYAGDFEVQKAQELGTKFDKMHPEEIALTMKGLGQSEREAFRIGQRLRMQDLADKSKTPASKLFGNEKIRKQLAASFEGKEDKYREFATKLKDEITYDETIKNLGLHKPTTEPEKLGFVGNAFASLLSVATTGFGKARLAVDTAKMGESILIKNYPGLNQKNAKELAKIFTDKRASIKLLENIVNKADKAQKPEIQRAINDIMPAIIGGSIGSQLGEGTSSEANAAETKSIEEIKAELQQQKENYPVIGQGIDVEKDAQQMKQRFYR